ncbi:MAG: DAK2 domain-containing protein, partial [FCB group bacterium]|nr:DAK2 domain-containing protein [FCB group bacterium]
MVTCERWVAMVRAAAGQVRASQELLSNLDSHGGDGDHGTTMVRAMNCIEQAVAQDRSSSIPDLLRAIGWAVMGVDGGA